MFRFKNNVATVLYQDNHIPQAHITGQNRNKSLAERLAPLRRCPEIHRSCKGLQSLGHRSGAVEATGNAQRDLEKEEGPGSRPENRPNRDTCSCHEPREAQEGGEQRLGGKVLRSCQEHQEDLLGKDRQAQGIRSTSGKQWVWLCTEHS